MTRIMLDVPSGCTTMGTLGGDLKTKTNLLMMLLANMTQVTWAHSHVVGVVKIYATHTYVKTGAHITKVPEKERLRM